MGYSSRQVGASRKANCNNCSLGMAYQGYSAHLIQPGSLIRSGGRLTIQGSIVLGDYVQWVSTKEAPGPFSTGEMHLIRHIYMPRN